MSRPLTQEVGTSILKKKEGENGFGISATEINPISESFERLVSLKQFGFLYSMVFCLFLFCFVFWFGIF